MNTWNTHTHVFTLLQCYENRGGGWEHSFTHRANAIQLAFALAKSLECCSHVCTCLCWQINTQPRPHLHHTHIQARSYTNIYIGRANKERSLPWQPAYLFTPLSVVYAPSARMAPFTPILHDKTFLSTATECLFFMRQHFSKHLIVVFSVNRLQNGLRRHNNCHST